MNETRNFASDNSAPVHEKIIQAMLDINAGDAISYGYDPYTDAVKEKFKAAFGSNADVYFVFNGTGANVVSLSAAARPFEAVICSETAHIHWDECGATERFGGIKLLVLPAKSGKICASQLERYLPNLGNEHHSQPKVISITQSTEYGTLYTIPELKEFSAFAHANNMYLHMDGARLANAAAALGVSLKELTADAGVDILSFGGTKNGMMFGEAVVVFNPELSNNCKYVRKQGMQLASKMRYIAAQFDALLTNDLWRENALNANNMAKLLASKASELPGIEITNDVVVNAVFARIPAHTIQTLTKQFFFHVWDEQTNEVRWMTSYKTTEKDINDFIAALKANL